VPITLASDFDHTREKWVDKPLDYLTGVALAPAGDRVALTVRGQVFVAPVGQGRLIEASRRNGVRYRQATFLPDGKTLLTLSDESGEVEFWKLPANGIGARQQLTHDATTLRMSGVPSPDGKWIAYAERDQELWVHEIATGKVQRVAVSPGTDFDNADLAWSHDSNWLAYVVSASRGGLSRVYVYNLADNSNHAVTSARAASGNPAWSPDGKWLYYTSERNLESSVSSPWGNRQPEPQFERVDRIYMVALTPQTRSPFDPTDELSGNEADKPTPRPARPAAAANKSDSKAVVASDANKPAATETAKPEDAPKSPSTSPATDAPATPAAEKPAKPTGLAINFDGIESRQWEVPVPAGNLSRLLVTEKYLYYTDRGTGPNSRSRLVAVEIKNKDVETSTVMDDIKTYRLSADRKKLLVHKYEQSLKGDALYVFDTGAKAPSASTAPASIFPPCGSRTPHARTGAKSSSMPGGCTVIIFTTRRCTAWTGKPIWPNTCRWWIASPTAPNSTTRLPT
jgi:tricorn protease